MFWLVLLLVLAAIVGAIVALALRAKRDRARSNQLVPGQRLTAPLAWAGSHDPEALLHRRLRDALAALRANQAFDDDGMLLDVRVTLEQEAVALDQRLIAIATLAPRLRSEPLARATEAVESIEEAVASTVGLSTAAAAPRLQAAVDQVKARTDLVGEAWAELGAGTPSVEPLAPPTAAAQPRPAPPAAQPTEPPATAPPSEG